MVMVSFLGVHTRQFERMRDIYARVYRLPVIHEADGAVWMQMDDRAELHVYATDDSWHSFFGSAPVPGFLVDDFDAVAGQLESYGIEWLSDLQQGGGRRWRHYRAPDGNVYELMGLSSEASTRR